MRRRCFLGAGVAALSLGLAGCTSGGGGDGGGGSDGGTGESGGPRVYNVDAVPPVTENREFVTELRIEWAYDGRDILIPDEDRTRTAGAENSFLICQFRVENVGSAATQIAPAMFTIAAPSTENVFPNLSFDDGDQFPSRRLDPGDVATGWVAFSVPQLQDKLLLALDQDFFPEPVNATFERTDLKFTLDDDATGTTAPGETTAGG